MAEFVVAIGGNGVEPFTTTPGQLDTIRFEEDITRIAVFSDGAGELRVTNDGALPTIGEPGDSTVAYRLPALPSVRELSMSRESDTVMILSSAPTLVAVEVVR